MTDETRAQGSRPVPDLRDMAIRWREDRCGHTGTPDDSLAPYCCRECVADAEANVLPLLLDVLRAGFGAQGSREQAGPLVKLLADYRVAAEAGDDDWYWYDQVKARIKALQSAPTGSEEPQADKVATQAAEIAVLRAKLAEVQTQRDESMLMFDKLKSVHDTVVLQRYSAMAQFDRHVKWVAEQHARLMQEKIEELAINVDLFVDQKVRAEAAKSALRRLAMRIVAIRNAAAKPDRGFDLQWQLGRFIDEIEQVAGMRSSQLDALASSSSEEPRRLPTDPTA